MVIYFLVQVTWSYTYTRPGFTKKDRRSVPKDWWTEDVSELELDLFRSIISTVRVTKKLPPALIGEALHVYACKHLPDPMETQGLAQSSTARTEETLAKGKRVLESIVSMIPSEPGSVSGRFLLRLLKIANCVGASPSTKAELVRRSGRQLDEAMASDLLIPLPSNPREYDVGIVEAVLENFLVQLRRPIPPEESGRLLGSMARVAMIFDSYLQVIAQDTDFPVSKFCDLAGFLPEMARQDHDGLYRAIDTYLKVILVLSTPVNWIACQKSFPYDFQGSTRADLSHERMIHLTSCKTTVGSPTAQLSKHLKFHHSSICTALKETS